jgi:hypothetical protein
MVLSHHNQIDFLPALGGAKMTHTRSSRFGSHPARQASRAIQRVCQAGYHPAGSRAGRPAPREAHQRRPRGWIVVNSATNNVPDRWKALPFVDDDGSLGRCDSRWLALNEFECRRFGEVKKRSPPSLCCSGLANTLRAHDRDCSQAFEEWIQKTIDRPVEVKGRCHVQKTTKIPAPTLLLSTLLPYFLRILSVVPRFREGGPQLPRGQAAIALHHRPWLHGILGRQPRFGGFLLQLNRISVWKDDRF